MDHHYRYGGSGPPPPSYGGSGGGGGAYGGGASSGGPPRPGGPPPPNHGGPPRSLAPTPPPPPPPERRRRSCPWPTLTEAQLRDDTPSRRDGVPHAREKKFWRTVQVLVRVAGQEALRLSPPTVITAFLFAARYFALRSYARNDRFVIGTAALFLATKVGDEPRALEAVVKACLAARDAAGIGRAGKAAAKGSAAAAASAAETAAHLADPAYLASLREAVLTAERALLYALGFELELELPYAAFFAAIDRIRRACPDPEAVAFWEDVSHVQLGLNFINDSFRTQLCLMADWRFIGVGAVAKVCGHVGRACPQVDGFPFWRSQCPDLTQGGLDEVVRTISSVYQAAPGAGGGGGGGGGGGAAAASAAAPPAAAAAAAAAAAPPPARVADTSAAALPPAPRPSHVSLAAGADHPSPASGDAATTPLVEEVGGPAAGPLPAQPRARPATAPAGPAAARALPLGKRSAGAAGLPDDRAAALASLKSLESGELPASGGAAAAGGAAVATAAAARPPLPAPAPER